MNQVQPNPVALDHCLSFDEIDQHRHLYCRHYDDCLDEMENRVGFTCMHCPVFHQWQRQGSPAPERETRESSPLIAESLTLNVSHLKHFPVPLRPAFSETLGRAAKMAGVQAEQAAAGGSLNQEIRELTARLVVEMLSSPAIIHHLDESLTERMEDLRKERMKMGMLRRRLNVKGLDQAARVLGVSRRTVQRLMKQGAPIRLFRGRYFANRSELIRWRQSAFGEKIRDGRE
ncbi:MAG: hypothetical protein GMKNLPBB_00828 [Myxococcota bacterium]|nr:hypothetical protein [Myxococcota bacterium]